MGLNPSLLHNKIASLCDLPVTIHCYVLVWGYMHHIILYMSYNRNLMVILLRQTVGLDPSFTLSIYTGGTRRKRHQARILVSRIILRTQSGSHSSPHLSA